LDFPVGADDICRIIPIRVVRVSSAIARIKKKASHAMSIKLGSQQQRLKNEIGTHICIQEINIQ
jgi:hypothetical protein